MFATDMADLPLNAAETVTANSGAEVAMATTVKPITKSERPNLRAIREADSTTQVAPPHKPKIVKMIINIFTKIITPK